VSPTPRRRRGRPHWWLHYSRYVTRRRGRLWSVESADGEVIRQYPGNRYDRADEFAQKLNHEEWEQAYKASRPKRKVKKVASR
jgi:hypothetical protein